jgi:hypothetical protein
MKRHEEELEEDDAGLIEEIGRGGPPGLRPPEQRGEPPTLGPLWKKPRTRASTPNLTGKTPGD